ncbi:phosphotransferase [Neobacillus sp. NRS-1170]|uniref:phosphotransferase n=1 Tax=Neobacillus sp. NRS-1170 TaxID=3233898 RepID=UPI003D2A39DD
MNSKDEIISQWPRFGWDKELSKALGKPVKLAKDQIENLKNSREKTSIWKLVMTDGRESIPIVLKIFKKPLKDKHILEIEMYSKAFHVFNEIMPKLYWLENVNNKEIWMFTEFIQPLRGQIKLAPQHLERIIPLVAEFHAKTFEKRFQKHSHLFGSSLPHFDSDQKSKKNVELIEKTREYLDLAMKDKNLKELVKPKYRAIQKILNKGPVFFPEIFETGQCLIHGDLHVHNICIKNGCDSEDWDLRLIDWESIKYGPCWYDLVVLVELLVDFRSDWQKREEEIRNRCVQVYVQEMKKHGIIFQEEPLKLLKKAYLQRTLEKKLANHLRRSLDGQKSALLKRYLEKVVVWGKELGLL